LVDLEKQASGDALVRYAAPMFHQIEELWGHQSTRSVFANSVFASPSAAGVPPTVWTFDASGMSIFCSAPRRVETDRSEGLARSIVRTALARNRVSTREHLRTLAQEVEQVDYSERRRSQRPRRTLERAEDVLFARPPMSRAEWADRLHRVAPDRSPADVEPAIDAAVIANAAAAGGFTWLLATVRERLA
jgi:hypothetical protein